MILAVGASDGEWAVLQRIAAAMTPPPKVERVPDAGAAEARWVEEEPLAAVVLYCNRAEEWPRALCERVRRALRAPAAPIIGVLRDARPGDAARLRSAGADVALDGAATERELGLLLETVLQLHLRHQETLRREQALQTVLRQRTSDLWEMEERFRLLVEHSPDGILVIAPDRAVLDANPAACELLGAKRDQLLGGSLDAFFSHGHLETLRAAMEEWLEGGHRGIECELVSPAGRRQIEIRASAISAGGQRAVILHLRDLSERRRLEQERMEAETRYRRLVEQIPAITYVFDLLPRRTTYISPQVETLLGFRPEIWLQDPGLWLRQIHPEDRERVRHLICDVHDVSHEPFLLEYRVMAADGREVWIENRGTYMNLGDRWVLQGVMMDVTARRRAEQEIRAGWERLAQVQRMEAVGRLSAGIAHDFNNMLTAILGYGQLIEHDPALPDSIRADLQEMMQAARRAESLVRQLQAFSRPTPSERGPVDVNEVVRGMDRLLRRTLGRDVEIVTLLDDQPCPIEGDAARLSQALMNLAVRARDVLPPHGRLRVSTAVLVADEEFVRTRPGLPAGELVRLEVADNGPTLDDQSLARVFEPFARLGDERGSGMALAVVQSIITAMGGHIEAGRAEGGGTVFTMYFPHRPDLVGAVAHEAAVGEVPGGRECVLVVDDEPGVRALAARMLRSAGYEVVEAANGIEALHLFEREPNRFDLVLTDIIMPAMSGPELIERLLAIRPSVRAICMTGYAHDPFAVVSASARVPVLSKPFTRAHLLFEVRQCLDAGAGGGGAPSA
ncbi:MAG: PAS domain S-box protein [Kiritimatiellae bacterium]|nr:PAS domain S-box protein [Kiritimatiellia bacterium]